MLRDLFHHKLDLEESHRIPSRDLHKNRARIREEFAAVEKRTFEGLLERFVRAVVALGDPVTEKAAGIVGIEGGEQVVHPDADNARPEDDVHRRTDALADDFICRGKRLGNPVLGNDQFAHAIVVKGNDGIGIPGDLIQRRLSLPHAALSLEGERHRCEDHEKDSFFPGDPADLGSGSGARPAAKSDADKDHLAAANRFPNLIDRFDGGLLAQGGITTSPHPFQQGRAQLNFLTGDGG